MKKLTNEEIKAELLVRFPEFKESEEFKKDLEPEGGPYEYFARFADYILREIKEKGDTNLVEKAFNFINNIHARKNLSAEVWDLLGIELFETFELDNKAKDFAKKYLKGAAIMAFEKQKGRPLD